MFTLQVYWQFNNGNIPTKRTCWNNNLLIRSSCPSLLQEKNSSEIEVLQFQALMTESHHSISWDHFSPQNWTFLALKQPRKYLIPWTVSNVLNWRLVWDTAKVSTGAVSFFLSVQSWRLILQRCTLPSLTVPTAVWRKCAPVLLCAKHQTCTRCLHCQMRKHLFIVCISVVLLWYVSM